MFAVALTLLILDVKPPDGNAGELADDLAAIAPRMGTFILSFAIVAYYWLVHHLVFASIRQVKIALIWTNFLFLLTIVVLPFSTAMERYIGSKQKLQEAVNDRLGIAVATAPA